MTNEWIADLHIHSKYSRATSRDCDLPHLDQQARRKGIALIGTGDFTHPQWRKEMAEQLEPCEEGFYRLREEAALPARVRGNVPAPRFVVSGEISTIYKRDGHTRKVHHVILLPSLEAAETLAHKLEAIGNLHSDGRPILGLDSRELLSIVLDACPDAIYIPAHVWTPHFSVFGAFSAFGSLEECYGDLTPYVHALETGLSSDPPMNRRLSALDGLQLISNSDAHSPAKLGREANLLSCDFDYTALRRAIETGEGLCGTIEFFPEEGKYHLDGHRNCACCLEPTETLALGGLCPACGRKLTVGVAHRVEELADRAEPAAIGKPFESLMPLCELLADCMGVSPVAKRVQEAYDHLIQTVGTEFWILRHWPVAEAERVAGFAVGEALRRLRAGKVIRKAGYDGEYGVISLFEEGELQALGGQLSMQGLMGLQMASPSQKAERKLLPKSELIEEAVPTPAADALNPEQQEAATAAEPVVAVIAGPGTGKTKTLVSRIAWLMQEQHVPASQITAVTFTRQAAGELRQRLTALLGKRAAKGLCIGTFHSICLELIEKKSIIDPAKAAEVMGELLRERGEKRSPAEALRLISECKNGLPSTKETQVLRAAYDERLRALSVRDLDDVLLEALQADASKHKRFRHLLVDEFQDINPVQHALVRHWQQDSLFVIGDPDQSIYGFRGADAACFDRLLADQPDVRVVTLKTNYRSSSAVVDAARAVIAHNGGAERSLEAAQGAGEPVRVVVAQTAFDEAVWIAKEIGRMVGGTDMLAARTGERDRVKVRAFSDIAVLCRTRRGLEHVESCLQHDGIPCLICGRETFWADKKVLGALGFFRALLDSDGAFSLQTALDALWRVPTPLWGRVAAAMKSPSLREALARETVLASFVDAVEALSPRVMHEKPRKLLEALLEKADIHTRATERLLNAAGLFTSMPELLESALAGEEADLRRAVGRTSAGGAVRLMTLHGAKGLEFPVVFVAGVAQGELPLEREDDSADEAEERRLFFVGMTRAREELLLTCGGTPSPFLDELPATIRREQLRAHLPAERAEQLSMF